MRVFADTNVLVSAFATRGLCADLFEILVLEHELIVGEIVLRELRRVLRRRIGVLAHTAAEIEALMRTHTVVPKPRRHLKLGIRDPEDEWIVASAVAAGADLLVTGDADLLSLKKPPIRVVTPRGLWDLLRPPRY